jgi:hypothetical protein
MRSGASHGITATHQDQINSDLLAFIKGQKSATANASSTKPAKFVVFFIKDKGALSAGAGNEITMTEHAQAQAAQAS